MSNGNRSVFAEYIVGCALGVVDKPRVEWDAIDLRYSGFKIEVKSSAYCQSWFQKKPSAVQFSIRKAIFWSPETGTYTSEAVRSADLYVFCVYAERDKAKADVLDIPAWDFYVVSTTTLNRDFNAAKMLPLSVVKKVAAPCKWDGLKMTVDRVLADVVTNATSAGVGAPDVLAIEIAQGSGTGSRTAGSYRDSISQSRHFQRSPDAPPVES